MTRAIHLGIDVGGTASRWVACDDPGEVVARGRASGATGHVFNPAEKQRLDEALAAIAADLARAELAVADVAAGLTGFGSAVTDAVRQLLTTHFGVAPGATLIVDDMILAYAASFAPGAGHLVSAGTGSIGLHIGADESFVRVGGRGILIDDAGSGSWIALRALDAIYRAQDRSGSFEAVAGLARELFAAVGGDSWHDVRQFVYAGDRGRIGGLAVAVAKAAGAGDATALDILREAGSELARLAEALVARVGPRPIGFIGGVLDLHPAIEAAIRDRLAGQDVRRLSIDAALAAAQLHAAGSQPWRDLLRQKASLA